MATRHAVLSAGTMIGNDVRNRTGDDLGKIEEIMIDTTTGRVSYAVLSFGGFLGLGDKLFAIPWQSLQLDPEDHSFILDVDKETLENAPGFDKDDWPETDDRKWLESVYTYYGHDPYWR